MIISTVLWQYRDDSGEVFVPLYKGDYDKGAEEQKLSSCKNNNAKYISTSYVCLNLLFFGEEF